MAIGMGGRGSEAWAENDLAVTTKNLTRLEGDGGGAGGMEEVLAGG
jgi:hypothetical protein